MQALRILSSTPILPPRLPFPSCPTKDFSDERSDLIRHRLQPRRLFTDNNVINEEETKPQSDEELDYDTTSSIEKVSEEGSHNKPEHSEENEHHSYVMIRPESEKITDLQERGLTNAEDLLDIEKFIRMRDYYELPTSKRVDLLVQLAYDRLEKIAKRMDLQDQLDHLPDIDQ